MTLPPLVLFETHSDPMAKNIAFELLPKLKKIGYKVLCIEMPQNFSSEEIFEHVNIGIAESKESQSVVIALAKQKGVLPHLLREKTEVGLYALLTQLYPVSNGQDPYSIVANRFCRLEADSVLIKVLNLAKQHGFLIKGIDSNREIQNKLNDVQTLDAAQLIHAEREQTMSTHINRLKHEGMLYICGALHAAPLIQKCENLHYFYPRSKKWQPIEDAENEKGGYYETNFLKDPTQVISENEVSSFADRVIYQISLREYPQGNLQSKHLAKVFNAVFRVFMGPESYADIFVEKSTTPDIAHIETKLIANQIGTRTVSVNGKVHLVISKVNVKDIAERIFKLIPE